MMSVVLAAKAAQSHGSFFVAAVVDRLLSAADVIVARFTVVVIVPRRCGVAGSGRPVADIRPANADGSCTPIAAGDFGPEAAA